jgi:EmrB/QacA subfamily drug resistance transporter
MTHSSPTTSLDGWERFFVLLCVSVPSFMINLDANIVAVSLPSIERSLNADFAAIEWVVSAYTLTFASLVMTAGALADRYGRRRLLIIGLAIFSVASFVCGAAPNVTVLNGARALQGVGAAIQLSAALAILSHQFHGPQRARAFAFWGSVIGIASSLGPIAGGIITQKFGWEWAFYVNIPVGAGMIALTFYAVRESRDPHARRIDILGCLSLSASLFTLTLALISGNHEGWNHATILGDFAAAVALFVLFLVVEMKQERPMLDLSFFRNPTYIGVNVAGLAFASCLLTMLTYLPIYFQSGLSYDPESAGLLMLPMAIPLFIVPRIVVNYLSPRASGRVLLATGLALTSGGLLWMAVEAPRFNYLRMLGGMLIAGVGAGILNSELPRVSMSVIPPQRAGMASGIAGTVRFSGIVVGFAALGAALFGRISDVVSAEPLNLPYADTAALIRNIAGGDLSGRLGSSLTNWHVLAMRSFGSGYQTLFLAAGLFAGLAALISWRLIRTLDTLPLQRKVAAAHEAVLPVE